MMPKLLEIRENNQQNWMKALKLRNNWACLIVRNYNVTAAELASVIAACKSYYHLLPTVCNDAWPASNFFYLPLCKQIQGSSSPPAVICRHVWKSLVILRRLRDKVTLLVRDDGLFLTPLPTLCTGSNVTTPKTGKIPAKTKKTPQKWTILSDRIFFVFRFCVLIYPPGVTKRLTRPSPLFAWRRLRMISLF